MSFFSKMAATYRAVNEGRTTAEAHQMAESFLETKLPYDVGAHGYEIVSKIADYSSVEQMAMIYVVTYANRMEKYLPAGSCPTAWCSFSGVAALISGHGRVDHAAMDDNVTAGSSLNCVTLSSVM